MFLSGFEHSSEEFQHGSYFNFILSNGERTQGKDEGVDNYDWSTYTFYYSEHMMPEGVHKQIRSVEINHNNFYVCGFLFFDKCDKLIWEIGLNKQYDKRYKMLPAKVVLEENEMIVGVVAKIL